MKEIKVRRLSVSGPGGGGGWVLETGRVYVIKAGLGVPESASHKPRWKLGGTSQI